MTQPALHPGRALLGALFAEVLLVASAFLWVAVYSMLLNPGQPQAVYEAYAQAVSPWVSVVAGIVIFYALARWWARNLPTTLVMTGVVLAFDALLLAFLGIGTLSLGVVALSYASKACAAWLGGRAGAGAGPMAA